MGNARRNRIWIPKANRWTGTLALAVTISLWLTVVAAPAQAQTLTVIHNFTDKKDGGYPTAGLTKDKAGNFYGTASQGGTGGGTVFKLTRSGSGWLLTPLYEFMGGNDGFDPGARVVFGPDGSLYGTTVYGGQYGVGTVFKLRPSPTSCKTALCPWVETVLYSFSGQSDGSQPTGDLAFDRAGNLYGTTSAGALGGCGGGYGCGVVFEMTPSSGGWNFSVVYSFTGRSDGGLAAAGVIVDSSGKLFGTTVEGGAHGYGTVYQVTRSESGWTEKAIYSFSGSSDGAFPQAGLVMDSSGNLYGDAISKGDHNNGTAFELSPAGGSWSFKLLYAFGLESGQPAATLALDDTGNLYGTAYSGGKYGRGAVFELTPGAGSWTYTSLHDFGNGSDGEYPHSSVVFDANGNLYGTTQYGGNPGAGSVWQVAP